VAENVIVALIAVMSSSFLSNSLTSSETCPAPSVDLSEVTEVPSAGMVGAWAAPDPFDKTIRFWILSPAGYPWEMACRFHGDFQPGRPLPPPFVVLPACVLNPCNSFMKREKSAFYPWECRSTICTHLHTSPLSVALHRQANVRNARSGTRSSWSLLKSLSVDVNSEADGRDRI